MMPIFALIILKIFASILHNRILAHTNLLIDILNKKKQPSYNRQKEGCVFRRVRNSAKENMMYFVYYYITKALKFQYIDPQKMQKLFFSTVLLHYDGKSIKERWENNA